MSDLSSREIVVFQYLLDSAPLVQRSLTDNGFTLYTKVIDFSLIRITNRAKVFKVDIDDELFGNDLVLVFSDIFRAELHLSSLDIVSSLDECCVKHDAEHDFVGPASLRRKYYLHIAL